MKAAEPDEEEREERGTFRILRKPKRWSIGGITVRRVLEGPFPSSKASESQRGKRANED